MVQTSVRETQFETTSLRPIDGLYGMLNVFIDPVTTAKKVSARGSWLWPAAAITAVMIVMGVLMLPYTQQLIDAGIAAQNDPQNAAHARGVALIAAQVSMFSGPVFAIGLIAFFAWLTSGILEALGARVRFRDLFSLLMCCALIPMLQNIAGYVVVRARGLDIASVEQLRPPFGFDIFLPNLHGPLLAFVDFFSLFEIWYLIMLTWGVATLARCSKTMAFGAIAPAWVLPLLLAVGSAALR